MKFEEVDVTPQLASELLAASEQIVQRNYQRPRAERMAHDMRSGQWHLTHQAIAVGPDGAVFDGQHRLHAVIIANVPVRMLVAYDADPTTFGAVDTGRSRAPGDVLKIAGIGNPSIKASIARLLLAYDAVKGTTDALQAAARDVTTEDVHALVLGERGEHVAAGETVGARLARALGQLGLRTWISTAYVIVLESDVSDTIRVEFFERLADGAMLAPGSPILALRRWLVSGTGITTLNTHERPAACIANTIKALNDYTLGAERSIIIWRSTKERMPIVLTAEALEQSETSRERTERRRQARDRAARVERDEPEL